MKALATRLAQTLLLLGPVSLLLASPSFASSCSCPTIHCLYGSAGGCQITCAPLPDGTPRCALCEPPVCFSGFPIQAQCSCGPCSGNHENIDNKD